MYLRPRLFLFYLVNIECCGRVGKRPAKFLTLEITFLEFAEHDIIILRIYQYLTIAEKQEFLTTFLFECVEVLLVSLSQRGEHANGRLNDICKALHLAHLTDAGFKYADGTPLVKFPNGERDANL